MSFRTSFVLLGLTIMLLVYSNCSSSESGSGTEASTPLSSTCAAPPGVSSSPQNIEQAVELINSLPKPLTVPCFLEALSRPLDVYATISAASAQPAFSSQSPRFFLFKGPLIISVVPEGPSGTVMEFGVIKSVGRTLKGEVPFPLYGIISRALPYERIHSGGSTSCVGCHAAEARDTSITFANAFISQAVRPQAVTKVTFTNLQSHRLGCNGVGGGRCDFYRALFDHGEVRDTDFPATIP